MFSFYILSRPSETIRFHGQDSGAVEWPPIPSPQCLGVVGPATWGASGAIKMEMWDLIHQTCGIQENYMILIGYHRIF